jgi:NADPH:quinone reductase-like Zn-dependent oxidoreductase
MKAIRIHQRGGPENLVYEDAPIPKLQTGDALVRVYSMAITPTELTWDETYKTPDGVSRLPSIPGHDVAGVVEQVAAGASEVKVGDAVYALTDFSRDGSAAEYVAVHAADLAPKPRTLDFDRAAAVPLSGLTAWQALFDHAALASGQRVLIHGASGGVGTYAVQLAVWRGAHVIATASPANFEFVKKLGASEIIDYTSSRFETRVREVDVVLDTVGGDTLERSWGVLRPGGIVVTLPSPPPPNKAEEYDVRCVFFIVQPNRAELIEIRKLIDAGILQPSLEIVVPLQQAQQAFRHASGHHRGKIILRVVSPSTASAEHWPESPTA